MPKLSKNLVHSVFFVVRAIDNASLGSGFIVARGSDIMLGEPHRYAISNYHVTSTANCVIRINITDGKSRLLPFKSDDWRFNKSGDDLTAIDITDEVNDGDEISALSESLLLNQFKLENRGIGIGEDAFMIGFSGKCRKLAGSLRL